MKLRCLFVFCECAFRIFSQIKNDNTTLFQLNLTSTESCSIYEQNGVKLLNLENAMNLHPNGKDTSFYFENNNDFEVKIEFDEHLYYEFDL